MLNTNVSMQFDLDDHLNKNWNWSFGFGDFTIEKKRMKKITP